VIHLVAADGASFVLSREDAARLYDELWKLAGTRGAVSAASKLLHASKVSAAEQELIAAQQQLTPSESNAVREAIGRLQRG
jgi:hypothetical protein